MSARIDLTGQRFNRWTVLHQAPRLDASSAKKVHWRCVCDCGIEAVVVSGNLVSGLSKSCGCLHSELAAKRRFKHGFTSKENWESYKSEHGTWRSMIQRCTDETNPHYKHYGGRGITICARWLQSFANFIEDIGKKPDRSYSIERINNDGNYEPGNCRWATRSEQMLNQRRSRKNRNPQ